MGVEDNEEEEYILTRKLEADDFQNKRSKMGEGDVNSGNGSSDVNNKRRIIEGAEYLNVQVFNISPDGSKDAIYAGAIGSKADQITDVVLDGYNFQTSSLDDCWRIVGNCMKNCFSFKSSNTDAVSSVGVSNSDQSERRRNVDNSDKPDIVKKESAVSSDDGVVVDDDEWLFELFEGEFVSEGEICGKVKGSRSSGSGDDNDGASVPVHPAKVHFRWKVFSDAMIRTRLMG